MKKFLLLFFLAFSTVVWGKTYYVAPKTASPAGSDLNPGTIVKPWGTWQKAFDTAQAGDTVYFRGGIWYPTAYIEHNPLGGHGNNGTYLNPICFFNYPGEEPIIDCINFISTIDAPGLGLHNSNYIKVRGLSIRNVKEKVANHYITAVATVNVGVVWLDRITSHDNGGHGFQWSGYDTLYVTNCDSYNNADILSSDPGNRADGFAGGSGGEVQDTFKVAYYEGCRAWHNSDDGFDLGTSKQFQVTNCWSFLNGYLQYGAGVGFKTGPSEVLTTSKRRINRTLSAFNKYPGYAEQNLQDEYFGPVVEYSNNTAYKCQIGFGSDNGAFNCNSGHGRVIYSNNLVFSSKWKYFDQMYLTACHSAAPYYPHYTTHYNNTWIYAVEAPYWKYNPAVTVTDADFVLTDSITAIRQLTSTRKTDGSLPDITFLNLKDGSDLINAGKNVGLPYYGIAPDLGAFEYAGSNPSSKPVTSITVSGYGGLTSITTDNGTLQLSASVLPADATNKTVTWSITSGSDKATISSAGLITALDNGIAVVRATANDGSGVYGALTITISNQVITVTSISVTGIGGATTISTDNGTLQLYAAVLPSNSTNKTVTWSISSGTDKASISPTGLVTAVDNGTAVARATANDGSGVYSSLTIKISNQVTPVTNISVTGPGGATLISVIGGTLQLSTSVLPSNATNKTVTWSISSGKDKASISSTGLVTALDSGTTIARATANDGSWVYGVLTITISNLILPVTNITVSGAGGATTIATNHGTLQLNVSVLPLNATNKTVTWSISSGTDKASISSTGLVTAIDNGTTIARATANDGSGIYGTLVITITNQAIPVSSLAITSVGGVSTIITENGTIQLSVTVQPLNATNKAVTWSITSGINLASINSVTGLVTALDNGTVTVRATANDGSNVYGTYTITISYIKNTPPVIVVNYRSSSYSGFVNEINASGSFDVDKDNLTFTWTAAGNISVSSTTGSIIKYLASSVSSSQKVEFKLSISDGKTTQSKVIPIEILPYKPELEVAEIANIEASSFQTPYYPYNTIDGNIGTMWSANGDDQWLIIELKHPFSVQHVKLAFQPGQRRESYFDILGSIDKISWEPILNKTASCDFSGDLQVFEFPPSKTGKEFNYIKLVGLGNSSDTWNYISELKIFGYRYKNSLSYENLPVKIFPNPAREFINIRIDESTLSADFLQIINSTGSILLQEKLDPNLNDFTIPINLKQGLYIVQIGTGDLTVFTQKLVVSR